MSRIKVLVIDDSAVVRRLLKEMLAVDPRIDVVGTAADPYVARRKIKELSPDVLTLDVEMPKMNGLDFLDNLMRLRPMPVVMVSSQTKAGAEITLKALELGAIDFVCKPQIKLSDQLHAFRREIIDKIKAASTANIQHSSANFSSEEANGRAQARSGEAKNIAGTVKRLASSKKRSDSIDNQGGAVEVIAIGASTGGTEAIKNILAKMPRDMPPTIVVQHIPKTFSAAFARSANYLSAMTVTEAEDGDILERGHVYVAPGDRHLMLEWDGKSYRCSLDDGPDVNRHKPSADVMFSSVATVLGRRAVGVLLTGMGVDGARGLSELHRQGCLTIAQDQATSVVWGMPGEAVRLGAASEVLALEDIPERLKLVARHLSDEDNARVGVFE